MEKCPDGNNKVLSIGEVYGKMRLPAFFQLLIFEPMKRIVVIGSGNLAVNLLRAFASCEGLKLTAWVSRKQKEIPEFPYQVPHSSLAEPLPEADLYILAVSDNAIADLASRLDFGGGLVVHTSGAQSISSLRELSRNGVFYPLQTFSESRPLSMEGIPFLLETALPEDWEYLKEVVLALGGNPVKADSRQRLQAHLAAVFANNFSNHLWHLSQELLNTAGLDQQLLLPILKETLAKFEAGGAYNAQTGPARRGDNSSMELHRQLLGESTLRNIYDQISQNISETYGT